MAEEKKDQESWEEVPIEQKDHVPLDDELASIVDVIDEPDEAKAQSENSEEPKEESEESAPRYQRRINKLTAKHRDEERARQQVESENAQLRQRLDRLEQGVNQQQVDNFKSEYDSVKTALFEAAEAGDTAKQVELTEQLADMRAAARVADQQALVNQQMVQQRPAQQSPQQQQPPQLAMKWWNENRWFNSPGNETASASAREIDAQLDGEGWDKESPDYYAELDSRLQKRHPELYSKPTKAKPPIAPTKGSSGGSQSKQSKDGRLQFTREQLNMAKSLGITTEQGLKAYAAELQKQGQV